MRQDAVLFSGRQDDDWKRRLHDGPLQDAIALQWRARRDPALARVADEIAALVADLRDVLASAPAERPHFGARLGSLADGCRWARVTVEDRLDDEPDADAELALRVIGEALANLRHADAVTAHVIVEPVQGSLRVSVSDDGDGFDVASALVSRPGHLGLASLRDDVAAAGGRLRIRTRPGRGSHIQADLPLTARITWAPNLLSA